MLLKLAGTYSPLLYNSRQQIGLKPASVISLPVTCNTESFTGLVPQTPTVSVGLKM